MAGCTGIRTPVIGVAASARNATDWAKQALTQPVCFTARI